MPCGSAGGGQAGFPERALILKASEEQKENRSELLGGWGEEGRRRYFGRDEVCDWGFGSAEERWPHSRESASTHVAGGVPRCGPPTPLSRPAQRSLGHAWAPREHRSLRAPGPSRVGSGAGPTARAPGENPCSRAHLGLPRAAYGLLGAGSSLPCFVGGLSGTGTFGVPRQRQPCPPRTLICGKLKAGPCQQRGCR